MVFPIPSPSCPERSARKIRSGGGGHMNIRTASDGTVSADTTTSKTVTTMNSLDCAAGNLACNVPTLFEGMDTDEEDPENSATDFSDNY